MKVIATRLACMAAMVTLAGCSYGDETGDGLVTRADEPGSEMSALVGGELTIDDRCVLLSGNPVVWPAGTTLSDDRSEVELPNGEAIAPGDTVQGGGGQIPASAIRETALELDGDLDAALRCAPAASDVVVFTVRGDDLTVSRP